MARAIWQRTVLAESDGTVVVEGNHYFPKEEVRMEYLRPSDTHTVCPWKGTASYYGERNADAAWYYPEPKAAAEKVKNRVAFWKGVRVEP
jgi:uncharacterized protein (DUF427 family)